MSKKNLMLSTLLALSSLFNTAYAAENRNFSSNASNIYNNLVFAGIGAIGGYSLHERMNGKESIEKNKTIVEKNAQINDWKEKYKKLKKENEELKTENDNLKVKNYNLRQTGMTNAYFEDLVEQSEIKKWLKDRSLDPNSLLEQKKYLLRWVLKSRCLENYLTDNNGAVAKCCDGKCWLYSNLLLYFTQHIGKMCRRDFDNIFEGEDPVASFNKLNDESKKVFLEAAVKTMAVVSATTELDNNANIRCWQDICSADYGILSKCRNIVNTKW